jgi:glycosyltransferase involved in cell wall biosynthesis
MPCEQQVTVIIPHIPTRGHELMCAVASVDAQTHLARGIIIATDTYRDGSAITRNRALLHVSTPWVAFLDDDDEWMPHHLEVLTRTAIEQEAQVVYSGCIVLGPDGFRVPMREEWGRFGKPFDPDLLREKSYIPVTSLVRTGLARKAMFGPPASHPDSDYDDWGFYVRLLDLGAHFVHVPETTWRWNHTGRNTSGRPDRW